MPTARSAASRPPLVHADPADGARRRARGRTAPGGRWASRAPRRGRPADGRRRGAGARSTSSTPTPVAERGLDPGPQVAAPRQGHRRGRPVHGHGRRQRGRARTRSPGGRSRARAGPSRWPTARSRSRSSSASASERGARAGDRLGPERPAVQAEQALGRRRQEREGPGARGDHGVVAPGRRGLQPLQQVERVHALLEQGTGARRGQHHLVQGAGLERPERPPEHPPPVGAVGVVAAHERERERPGRRVVVGAAERGERGPRRRRGARRGPGGRPASPGARRSGTRRAGSANRAAPNAAHSRPTPGAGVEPDGRGQPGARRQEAEHVRQPVGVVEAVGVDRERSADTRAGFGLAAVRAQYDWAPGALAGQPPERVSGAGGDIDAEDVAAAPGPERVGQGAGRAETRRGAGGPGRGGRRGTVGGTVGASGQGIP